MATASMTHPVYTAKLITETDSTTTTYTLNNIMTDLVVAHPKNELAEKVTLALVNIKVGTQKLHEIVGLQNKVYVYANTGSGEKEVFNGLVWARGFDEESDGNEIKLTCYDKLIYFHKSKDNLFVKSGKQTKDILTSFASDWGFSISYKYASVSHPKLVFHNETIADIFVTILEEVKKKTGIGYVIHLENGTIVIDYEGSNTTVYKIAKGQNAIKASYVETMEGMVTKVQIVKAETVSKGNSEEETGKYLTVTSLSNNTNKYGTLQEIVVKEKDEELSKAKEEAQKILDEKSKPIEEHEVTAIDIPWLKKGHQIYIQTETLTNYYVVKSVEHDAMNHTMFLEVERYE